MTFQTLFRSNLDMTILENPFRIMWYKISRRTVVQYFFLQTEGHFRSLYNSVNNGLRVKNMPKFQLILTIVTKYYVVFFYALTITIK